MSEQCVAAVYDSFAKARDAVQALEKSSFPAEQVSLAAHNVEQEVPHEQSLQHGDQTEEAAAKGAGLGGLVGLLMATPLLAVPGVGPVLLAGPLAASMTGALVGGIVGAMSGWGVHEDHIREYDEKLRSGAFLIVANGDPQQVEVAKQVLDATNAESVRLHAATSADAPEIDE